MAKRVRVWVQQFKGRKNLYLQWHDPEIEGKRNSVSTGTSDPAKAEDQRADLEYELNNNLHDRPSRVLWSKFIRLYIRQKFGGKIVKGDDPKSPLLGRIDPATENTPVNTLLKLRAVLNGYTSKMKPDTLGDVTAKTLARYMMEMREDGQSPSTITGHIVYLRTMLKWAQSQGYISSVPVVTMPKIPKGANKVKVRAAAKLSEADFDRLIKYCPTNSWKLLVSFAWHCGMRRNEAMGVHGEHIDLANHIINIPRNKSRDQSHQVVIPPELDTILRKMFPDGIPDGPIVREIPACDKEVSRFFVDKIAKPAGVKGNSRRTGFVTLHDLRRSYGSRWASKVVPQVLRELMRHSDLKTTLEFYADTRDAAMKAIWSDT